MRSSPRRRAAHRSVHRTVRRTVRRTLLGAVASGLMVGCIARERTNAACAWRGDVEALAAPGTRARASHLVEDTRVAQELGVRHADSAIGRPPPVMSDWERAERGCTDRALAAAVRQHAAAGLTRAELDWYVGGRDWWFDLLAVFLPVGVLLALASRRVARHVAAGSDGDWHVPAVLLAVLTPVVAGLALGLTQMWGWQAEMLRLRDNHISYRAFQLPASRHPWSVVAGAAAVFAAAAVVEVRRFRQGARAVAGAGRRSRRV